MPSSLEFKPASLHTTDFILSVYSTGEVIQGHNENPAPLYITWPANAYIVASELKDPICHSNECQIGSFSAQATICVCHIPVYLLNAKDDCYRFYSVYLVG